MREKSTRYYLPKPGPNTDNREQLVETLEANTGERLTALEAIGEAAPVKAAVSAEAASAFVDGLRAERQAAQLRAEEAEHAALRAVDDREALRDRLAARARQAEQEVAADALLAEETNRARDALEAADAARLESYRSLETALAARLPPDGALFDSTLDAASMARHGAACREAAFGLVAREALAAGEAALAGVAQGKASDLGQAAQHWAYKLENRRHTLAVTAERAPPLTTADVRAWRELRARQANARDHAAALAAGIAAQNAEGAAAWRKQAGEYRDRAAAIRGTLATLDELETLVQVAEPEDEAAWSAAARAAERIMEGAGRGFDEEAERARERETRARQARRAVFADKASRPFVARARQLVADPDLDDEAKTRLDRFLREHDDVRPEVVRRTRQLFSQWKAVCETAKARGVSRFVIDEAPEIVAAMGKLAAEHPGHLSVKQKSMFLVIGAEYEQHIERQLTQKLSQGLSM